MAHAGLIPAIPSSGSFSNDSKPKAARLRMLHRQSMLWRSLCRYWELGPNSTQTRESVIPLSVRAHAPKCRSFGCVWPCALVASSVTLQRVQLELICWTAVLAFTVIALVLDPWTPWTPWTHRPKYIFCGRRSCRLLLFATCKIAHHGPRATRRH